MITTKLYLDTRSQSGAERPAPLKLSIHLHKQTAYIFTGYKILPKEWEQKTMLAKDKNTNLSVSRFKFRVDSILADWQSSRKLDGLNASTVKRLLEIELSPDTTGGIRFLEHLEVFGSTRPKKRTREIYAATVDRIRAFDRGAELLTFDDITYGWLDRFDGFLARTSPKKNARNIHFRNIRAAFNDARKKKYTQCYPFLEYQVHPEPTAKKDLLLDQIRSLFNAKVKPWQEKYLDFFKMSFMLIGMNTEDMIHVKEICGGRIEYIRAKTGKPYSIKVEPECLELINKYRGQAYLLNVLDTYSRTCHWTSKVNNELKEICKENGLPSVSINWARHSWSTLAINELDIPKDTVSRSMGHGSKSVTDIYIHFDRTKIDRANRQVLDLVLYDRRNADVYELIRQLNEKVEKLA